MYAKLFVELGEDVGFRRAHLARSLATMVMPASTQDLPIAKGSPQEFIVGLGYSKFTLE